MQLTALTLVNDLLCTMSNESALLNGIRRNVLHVCSGITVHVALPLGEPASLATLPPPRGNHYQGVGPGFSLLYSSIHDSSAKQNIESLEVR